LAVFDDVVGYHRLEVRHVVLPRYEPGVDTEMELLDHARGAAFVLPHLLNAERHADPFTAVCDLIDQVEVRTLIYSDGRAAADWLIESVSNPPEPSVAPVRRPGTLGASEAPPTLGTDHMDEHTRVALASRVSVYGDDDNLCLFDMNSQQTALVSGSLARWMAAGIAPASADELAQEGSDVAGELASLVEIGRRGFFAGVIADLAPVSFEDSVAQVWDTSARAMGDPTGE